MIEISPHMNVHQAAALAKGLGRPIVADGDRRRFYIEPKGKGFTPHIAHNEPKGGPQCHAE